MNVINTQVNKFFSHKNYFFFWFPCKVSDEIIRNNPNEVQNDSYLKLKALVELLSTSWKWEKLGWKLLFAVYDERNVWSIMCKLFWNQKLLRWTNFKAILSCYTIRLEKTRNTNGKFYNFEGNFLSILMDFVFEWRLWIRSICSH